MVPRTDLSSEPWNPGAAPGLGPQCQASTLRHSMFPGEGVSGSRRGCRCKMTAAASRPEHPAARLGVLGGLHIAACSTG